MKLVKLSLASIIAAGALANLASAASLEEAIKNVDVTGYARYRYDSTNTKDPEGQRTGNSTDSTHRFTSDIDFKAAIDDRFLVLLALDMIVLITQVIELMLEQWLAKMIMAMMNLAKHLMFVNFI